MRKWLEGILLILSIILLSISLYFLMGMYLEDQQSATGFDKIRQIYEEADNDAEDDSKEKQEKSIHPGLLALHEKNPDCIGWINIEGTAIDYPVMYHPEEENYYLRRNFNQDYDISGTPFLAEACDPDDSDNLIIYGHHMKNGTMFAALDQYKSEDYFHKHPIITYDTLTGPRTYQIIAAFATPVYTSTDFSYYRFIKAESPKAFTDFVETCKQKSYYDTQLTATYGDELITLSTCEYSHKNGRMVVIGKRINERR